MSTKENNTTWNLESEEWWANYREMVQKESMRAPGLPWTKEKVEEPEPAAAPFEIPSSGSAYPSFCAAPCSASAPVYTAVPDSGSAYCFNTTEYDTYVSSGSAYSISPAYGTEISSGSAYELWTEASPVSSGSGNLYTETTGYFAGPGSFPSSGSGSGSSGCGAEFGGYGLHLI